jgi:signal transduction histidine kinase
MLVEGRRLACASSSDDLAGLAEQAQRQLHQTMDEMVELARGLHPLALDQRGLADALSELASRSAVPIGLHVSVPDLAPEVATAAYFVCAEGVANLTKHASAGSAAIEVHVRDGRLVVQVADDGAGGAHLAGGSGLRGLADRVEALGGRLTVDSSVGAGTHLTAELPLGGVVLLPQASVDPRERRAAEERRDQPV